MAARHVAETLRSHRIGRKVDFPPFMEEVLEEEAPEERSVDGAVHGEGSVHLPGVGSPWTLGDEGGWHEGGDEIRHPEADGARH